ncbi:N-formylglutamate amidohydrolase [Mangrovicella endophytica]|uniref:N-formylglutamate amidohydrolase n=1 Tax=Mangrovicella endophytica TaxID=2066697 RepID=UPI000C9EC5C7|nr:N-formylglutamate amidohydrolase [Mangrovicella endophytica]
MTTLLQPGDPIPFGLENEGGSSPFVFACDHAGLAVPRRLGDLGLPEAELSRHIGWDIGIHGVTQALAQALDAPYVYQPYSRLVIDCNRQPGHLQSIAPVSDTTPVPANADLSGADRRSRENEILEPYHATLKGLLDRRAAAGRPTIFFAMHSCTDMLRSDGFARPWEIGVLADRDWRLGDALIAVLEEETSFTVGRNQPYSVSSQTDYTVPVHAEGRGLAYAEIEIRQDLIGEPAGQREWAALLARLFPMAAERAGVLPR